MKDLPSHLLPGPDAPLYVGIDIGGTATRLVAIEEDTSIHAQCTVATPRELATDSHSGFFANRIHELLDGRPLGGVGIGATGPIGTDGVLRNPDTLPGFTNADIRSTLETRLGVTCIIENDAVAAAIGETMRGAARSAHMTVMVTLGTGVGVCAIHGGVPHKGGDGWHPEAGHISISGPLAPCYCGRTTCWEQAASRTALQRSCAVLIHQPFGDDRDIRTIRDRANNHDEEAQQVFDEYGRRVADGLATLLTIFRPDCVVLGGTGATYLPTYKSSLLDTLAKIRGCYPSFQITTSELGDLGGAIGAAILGHKQASRPEPEEGK